MAANALAEAGAEVTIAEGKPSAGRKFLMAGKSGLNITKSEPFETFIKAFGASAAHLRPMVQDFGPEDTIRFCESLGQAVFTGASGRVFPTAMKASPLLRAWLERLDRQGAVLQRGWRWQGWDGDDTLFETPEGTVLLRPDVTVLALGGASWARLGSDGAWVKHLDGLAELTPFEASNGGFAVEWSPYMTDFFGEPVKSLRLTAGGPTVLGEIMISHKGVEGSGIYHLSPALRKGARLVIDLLPDWPLAKVAARLNRPRGKTTLSNHLRKTLGLPQVKLALLHECAHPLPKETTALAALIKALPLKLSGPLPMDEAISTAGGIQWDSLTMGLELRNRPGVFCAGEMLDWDAPTGGYLITASMATGLWAGRHAAAKIN